MEAHWIECLACGETRQVGRGPERQMHVGECARCGYLGWARTGDLTELARRALRERPPEARRLRVA